MIRNSDIDRLRGLFAKRLIATMDMLKKTVGTVADLTVYLGGVHQCIACS